MHTEEKLNQTVQSERKLGGIKKKAKLNQRSHFNLFHCSFQYSFNYAETPSDEDLHSKYDTSASLL